MNENEADQFIRASQEVFERPQHPISSPPPPSPSPEPEDLSEYLQPVYSDHEVAHIPDGPSESDTESEPEDLSAQLSDGDWTEVAATTASTNVSANVGKGLIVSFSAVSNSTGLFQLVCGILKVVLGRKPTPCCGSPTHRSGMMIILNSMGETLTDLNFSLQP